ncbi:MAG: serine hydrolase domain-containing protein, partial [Actinomycetota bacterium]
IATLLLAVSCAAEPSSAWLQLEADRLIKEDTTGGGVILAIVEADGDVTAAASPGTKTDDHPIRPDHRFRIGSVTKTFVATVVLQLHDEGLVDLDAPAADYFPEPTMPEGVTVRHLLGHTSGAPEYVGHEGYWERVRGSPAVPLTQREILNFIRDDPPLFDPGDRWSYSNTNYIYLGLLIEAVTGKEVAAVLRDRVTGPLGLEDTYMAGDEVGPPVVQAPIWIPEVPSHSCDECLVGLQYDYPYASTATGAWTAGAIVSSAADLATFFTALFNGTLISRDALGQMTSGEPLSGGHDPVVAYGLGLTKYAPAEYDAAEPDITFYGHGGGLPGFSTLVWHEPRSRATLILMSTDARIDLTPAALVMAHYVYDQEH